MFTDNELRATKDFIQRKKEDIFQAGDKISDLDYIRSLQTLTKLEDAVNKKMHSTEKSE